MLSSVAHHVEYVWISARTCSVCFSSFLLRLVSELQVSRRCCGLVAVYAWCVLIARTDAVLFGVAWK